ncbi:hypothetical protein ACS0TY_032979 [Phlomoides rotata]
MVVGQGWLLYNCVQLLWKGLGGRISEKIGQQQALRRLSLHDNELVGAVPTSLGFLRNLRGVYLFNNRLSGSIPAAIGNCPLLQTFGLSNNQLNGVIPPSLGDSAKLYRLNLSFNYFSSLQYNNLSGSVPDSWGSGNVSHQLQFLSVDHNLLSGKIPASLSKLNLLEEINLSNNQIGGSIPNELGDLSRLKSIDLSNNLINRSFPESLSNLASLQRLNLENNFLDSSIPDSIEKLQNLIVLNLSSNRFKGQIPDTVGNITSVTNLDLSENHTHRRNPNLPFQFTKPFFLQSGALLVVLLILCCVLLCCLIGKKAGSKTKTISEKGHVKPANYLDAHEKFLLGVATKGASASADSSPKSQLLQQIFFDRFATIYCHFSSDMLVHLAREKYENNLRIPKSLEKVSVLFADWYNICETSDHFFGRIMELSVSNCVSSEDMKPQSHQGQQISFLLLLRFFPVDQGSSKLSLLPKLCMARVGLSWEFHAKITHRKWTEGVALFSKIAGRLVPVHGALFQLDPVHFLYKGTHTRALLTWELFYFAMSQNCYDHYWLRLDFQKICVSF